VLLAGAWITMMVAPITHCAQPILEEKFNFSFRKKWASIALTKTRGEVLVLML
jgi:hypothetical protein